MRVSRSAVRRGRRGPSETRHGHAHGRIRPPGEGRGKASAVKRAPRQSPRAAARERRHRRIRRKVSGSAERPRLAVKRSLKHVSGQIIDDSRGVTLVGVSSADPGLRDAAPAAPGREEGSAPERTKTARARVAGRALAERAREQGIQRVVFDRGGYVYHGRVKAFAEGAREGGLEF